jgi:hypothetical protein
MAVLLRLKGKKDATAGNKKMRRTKRAFCERLLRLSQIWNSKQNLFSMLQKLRSARQPKPTRTQYLYDSVTIRPSSDEMRAE